MKLSASTIKIGQMREYWIILERRTFYLHPKETLSNSFWYCFYCNAKHLQINYVNDVYMSTNYLKKNGIVQSFGNLLIIYKHNNFRHCSLLYIAYMHELCRIQTWTIYKIYASHSKCDDSKYNVGRRTMRVRFVLLYKCIYSDFYLVFCEIWLIKHSQWGRSKPYKASPPRCKTEQTSIHIGCEYLKRQKKEEI